MKITNLEIVLVRSTKRTSSKQGNHSAEIIKKVFPTEMLHYSIRFSPENAFHNSTIEYDILIQQGMSMRMKLVQLNEKQK